MKTLGIMGAFASLALAGRAVAQAEEDEIEVIYDGDLKDIPEDEIEAFIARHANVPEDLREYTEREEKRRKEYREHYAVLNPPRKIQTPQEYQEMRKKQKRRNALIKNRRKLGGGRP